MHTVKPLTVIEGVNTEKSFMTYLTPAIHKDPIQTYESVVRINEIADVVFPLQEPGLGV